MKVLIYNDIYFRTKIRVGEHEIKGEELIASEDCEEHYMYTFCNKVYQDMDIEDVIIHPGYSPQHLFINDIALIRLKTKVKRNGNKFFQSI